MASESDPPISHDLTSIVGETIRLHDDAWQVTAKQLGVGGFARVFEARAAPAHSRVKRAAVKASAPPGLTTLIWPGARSSRPVRRGAIR